MNDTHTLNIDHSFRIQREMKLNFLTNENHEQIETFFVANDDQRRMARGWIGECQSLEPPGFTGLGLSGRHYGCKLEYLMQCCTFFGVIHIFWEYTKKIH